MQFLLFFVKYEIFCFYSIVFRVISTFQVGNCQSATIYIFTSFVSVLYLKVIDT